MEALVRMHDHLEPGGTLLIDIEVPYANPGHWEYWLKDKRVSLPETDEPPVAGVAHPTAASMPCPHAWFL